MRYSGKSLKQRQQETGRTLALDGKAWRRLRAAILGAALRAGIEAC